MRSALDKGNLHSVLFTGGLDSAYRLCQLAQDEKAVVQPVYIMFPDDGHPHKRPELKREIEAQDRILGYIRSNPGTKAKFLPMKRIHRDEVPKDERVMGLETELSGYRFGWQYLYIAMLARWMPGLELCHETLPEEMLCGEVGFVGEGFRRKIDVSSTKDIFVVLFGNLVWPILGVSRQQMLSDLKRWKYDKVLGHVWFCYWSIDGNPCGICDNCVVKIQEGLEFLFPAEAVKRYYVFRVCKLYSLKCQFFYEFYVRSGRKPDFDYLVNAVGDERNWIPVWLSIIRKLETFDVKRLKSIIEKYRFLHGRRDIQEAVYHDIMKGR